MSLFRLVAQSLREHALSTAITSVSIALAAGLLMAVWAVRDQAQATFTQLNGGFDAVLGARSSKLQLVLNAVFQLEASPANITWADYQEIRNHPGVAEAVPLAMGDNFRGYRVVGTAPELIAKHEYAAGRGYRVRPPGRIFDPGRREAVVGSFAARKLGLAYGSRFRPYHGLNFNEAHAHEEEYVVVGVLEPSNTPADKVIWIPLEGVQKMSGHAAETADDLSAVLIQLRGASAFGPALDQFYNKKGSRLTFAWPIGATMAELFARIGWFDRVLALVAGLVALVAAGSVTASIYNSMNERRRQIAILRALGARRSFVARWIVLEAMAIAAIGALGGFGVYGLIMTGAAAILQTQTGVVLDTLALHPIMLWAPLGLVALSAVAGLIPAVNGYRTDVAEHLAPVH